MQNFYFFKYILWQRVVISMKKILKYPKHWLLLGIPILWAMGFIFHSFYDYTGKIILIGVFCPVNESVWEHLKLILYPTLLWFGLGYIIFSKGPKFNGTKWLICTASSILVSSLFIIVFYYSYTGSLGIHSMILDIASLIIGVFIAQILCAHIYKYGKGYSITFYASLIFLGIAIVTFTYFTFSPPQIPLFRDALSGRYGI